MSKSKTRMLLAGGVLATAPFTMGFLRSCTDLSHGVQATTGCTFRERACDLLLAHEQTQAILEMLVQEPELPPLGTDPNPIRRGITGAAALGVGDGTLWSGASGSKRACPRREG